MFPLRLDQTLKSEANFWSLKLVLREEKNKCLFDFFNLLLTAEKVPKNQTFTWQELLPTHWAHNRSWKKQQIFHFQPEVKM